MTQSATMHQSCLPNKDTPAIILHIAQAAKRISTVPCEAFVQSEQMVLTEREINIDAKLAQASLPTENGLTRWKLLDVRIRTT